jgi:hypothetical protein
LVAAVVGDDRQALGALARDRLDQRLGVADQTEAAVTSSSMSRGSTVIKHERA